MAPTTRRVVTNPRDPRRRLPNPTETDGKFGLHTEHKVHDLSDAFLLQNRIGEELHVQKLFPDPDEFRAVPDTVRVELNKVDFTSGNDQEAGLSSADQPGSQRIQSGVVGRAEEEVEQ